jgi:Tol biopolymer transport system component
VDWGPTASNIGVLDLVTKEYRLITDHPGMDEGMALSADFSPDGNTIAYTWLNSDGSIEIRLAFRDGSAPRTVCADSQFSYWPDAWAPDGKRLVAERERRGEESPVEMGWVSVGDGEFLVFTSADPGQPERQRWSPSPDGAYLAFDFDVPENARRRDIALIPADGGRPTPIIQHPANDQVVGWVP